MPEIELAQKAQEIARQYRNEEANRFHHISYEYMPTHKIFDKVTGTMIYVGCGQEFSSLFLFPNANIYIHQDLGDPNIEQLLIPLQEHQLISNLKSTRLYQGKREHRFSFLGKDKKLIEVIGDIGNVVPGEAKINLEAIYFFAMPYGEAIRSIETNLLPYLQIGGFFYGAYPYFGGKYEGAPPYELGLDMICCDFNKEVFQKVRQLSKEEIKKAINPRDQEPTF